MCCESKVKDIVALEQCEKGSLNSRSRGSTPRGLDYGDWTGAKGW